MNHKEKGEKGQQLLIGKLSEYDVSIALPLSDNLPWDMILVSSDGKPKKIQVKASENSGQTNGAIRFDFRRNNWYKRESKRYTATDTDAIIGCDLISKEFFVFLPCDFEGKSTATIRKEKSKNGQVKGILLADDFRLDQERLDMIFLQ